MKARTTCGIGLVDGRTAGEKVAAAGRDLVNQALAVCLHLGGRTGPEQRRRHVAAETGKAGEVLLHQLQVAAVEYPCGPTGRQPRVGDQLQPGFVECALDEGQRHHAGGDDAFHHTLE